MVQCTISEFYLFGTRFSRSVNINLAQSVISYVIMYNGVFDSSIYYQQEVPAVFGTEINFTRIRSLYSMNYSQLCMAPSLCFADLPIWHSLAYCLMSPLLVLAPESFPRLNGASVFLMTDGKSQISGSVSCQLFIVIFMFELAQQINRRINEIFFISRDFFRKMKVAL